MANSKSNSKAKTKSGAASKSGTRSKSASSSKAKARTQEMQAKKKADKRVVDEIWAIITIAVGVFFVVAVFTDGAGKLGEVLGTGLKGLFGWMAYIVPFYLTLYGVLLFARKTSHFNGKTFLLLLLMLFMLCTMNSIRFVNPQLIMWNKIKISNYYQMGTLLTSGGLFGMIIASALIQWIGNAGCWIFSIVVTMICLLLIINTPISRFFEKIGEKIEERRLMRENAHLDDGYDEEFSEVPVQRSGQEVKKPADPNAQERQPRLTGKERKQEYVSPSERAERAAGKKPGSNNLLTYMNDSELFDRNESSGMRGLEEANRGMAGYGLEEGTRRIKGYGLEGETSEPGEPVKQITEPKKFPDPIRINAYVQPEQKTETKSEAEGKGSEPAGTPDKAPVTKLTNKEASEAMLTSEELSSAKPIKKYKLPPVSLLDRGTVSSKEPSSALQAKAVKLEDTLKSFNVDASVVQVTQGPTVTRYEIQPAVGVKVSKIVNLADDIALNLRAKSIRIEAPIPGKAAIGIEIENETSTPVHFREIIDSKEFREAKSRITFALGKNISGEVIVANLKSMPHLLIAGSTGSGKSVCINSIITSLLYKATPDEVKMILIDPKVVELSNYDGIPHLLIPVVTDPTKAAAALNWAVAEMEERYNKFHIEGAKELEAYNDLVRINGEPEKVLPQIVIIIDELADLMMAASSQVQDSICRIAQKARAAGMHLIVATQRPSVDVITGVIKANIPSRIAFAVSSHVDSQTILDEKGAEKLVGKGDMLFKSQGEPIRIQGCFVSDREVNSVIDYIKSQVDDPAGTVDKEILARIERGDVNGGNSKDSGNETDELLMDCIELVVDSGQASVSMLQRRFRIGYNRAARIVDIMEEMGVVGPQDGSRPRQVIMTREQFEELQSIESENQQIF